MSLNMQPRLYSPHQAQTKQPFVKPQFSVDPLQNSMYQSTVKKMHPFSSNQQSPYTHSPNPQQNKLNYSLTVSRDELEHYKQKCTDLEKDLAVQKNNVKPTNTTDLQSRIQELIDQNRVLSGQVEQFNKQALQRRTEAEMWKQKYETQMGQLIQVKANYEMEIKTLNQEVQRVQAKMGTLEVEKYRQISDQRALSENQNNSQISTIKNSQTQQVEMYEIQIKKMRDIIEDKTISASQLQSQLVRTKAEQNDIQARLRNEIETLKNRMSSIQIDHQAELLALKNKLDLYKETQVKNVQQAHENQTDLLLNEIGKMRQLLEIKNQEIETLLQQNQKQKSSFEIDLADFRYENDQLRQKLYENEQIHQEENHNIQCNMENMHNNDLTSLKLQSEQQIIALNNENLKLKEIIDSKNGEIEKQQIEKAQQKDYYDSEINRLMQTIEDYKRKVKRIFKKFF